MLIVEHRLNILFFPTVQVFRLSCTFKNLWNSPSKIKLTPTVYLIGNKKLQCWRTMKIFASDACHQLGPSGKLPSWERHWTSLLTGSLSVTHRDSVVSVASWKTLYTPCLGILGGRCFLLCRICLQERVGSSFLHIWRLEPHHRISCHCVPHYKTTWGGKLITNSVSPMWICRVKIFQSLWYFFPYLWRFFFRWWWVPFLLSYPEVGQIPFPRT